MKTSFIDFKSPEKIYDHIWNTIQWFSTALNDFSSSRQNTRANLLSAHGEPPGHPRMVGRDASDGGFSQVGSQGLFANDMLSYFDDTE